MPAETGRACLERQDFIRKLRSSETLVTPVIHVLDVEQALRNLDVIDAAGCPGAFLINHDFPMEPFLPILKEIRAARQDLWLGANFLDQPGDVAFPVLGSLAANGVRIDAYWADDARIDERTANQFEARKIERIRQDSGWDGVYVGGVAFKKQRPVSKENYAAAARASMPYLDVIATSGIATGHEVELTKVQAFRSAIGNHPLALASGISPENAASYCEFVNCFMVATGINYDGDFYNIDPNRLNALLAVTRNHGDTS